MKNIFSWLAVSALVRSYGYQRYFARYEVTADDTEGDYVCITHVLPFTHNFEELNSMFGKDKWHYTGLVYEGEPSRIRKQ